MDKICVNDQYNFEIATEKGQTIINGSPVQVDIFPVNPATFHVLHENRSFTAELTGINRAEKTCSVRVNSSVYWMKITDRFDELLHELGMDNLNKVKIAELKAPMPGMVLKILVKEGDEVKRGDNLLILEAMKMENMIKSPGDLLIRSIKVTSSDKVEKNQVMIVFD